MKHVVIRGAGLTGLATAWYAYKHYKGRAKITLVEKSGRAGGWIRTIEKEGFHFEQGPRGFRHNELTLELVYELGLEKELITNAAPHRYLYLDGRLQKFWLPFLIKNGLLGALWRERKVLPTEGEESIASFFIRHLGKHLTDVVIDPLVKGIYGGDPYKLSMRACFPLFHQWERQHGTLLKGFLRGRKSTGALYSFRGGMETLTRTLVERVPAEILYNTEEVPTADVVLSALPPDAYPCATLTTVNLGWWQSQLHKQRGFGYLVPSKEKEKILGMTWDTQIFPEHNRPGQTRMCVMVGEEKEPLAVARDALERHLGITTPPDIYDVNVAHGAIPQFLLGMKHPDRGVGVNACIAAAKKLLEAQS